MNKKNGKKHIHTEFQREKKMRENKFKLKCNRHAANTLNTITHTHKKKKKNNKYCTIAAAKYDPNHRFIWFICLEKTNHANKSHCACAIVNSLVCYGL